MKIGSGYIVTAIGISMLFLFQNCDDSWSALESAAPEISSANMASEATTEYTVPDDWPERNRQLDAFSFDTVSHQQRIDRVYKENTKPCGSIPNTVCGYGQETWKYGYAVDPMAFPGGDTVLSVPFTTNNTSHRLIFSMQTQVAYKAKNYHLWFSKEPGSRQAIAKNCYVESGSLIFGSPQFVTEGTPYYNDPRSRGYCHLKSNTKYYLNIQSRVRASKGSLEKMDNLGFMPGN